MFKAIKEIKKKLRKQSNTSIVIGCKINDCDNCIQDSIAHEIKHHFELNYIENRLLMRYDREKDKLLISKRQLNHLIRLAHSVETRKEYDFELVDYLDV